MFKLAICDDNIIFCSKLEKALLFLEKELCQKFSIDIYYSGETLLEAMSLGDSFELIFLDIELTGKSGIKVGEIIRKTNSNLQIIYMSVEQSYAMQLFKNKPLDFIIKPFDEVKLREVLEHGIRVLDEEKSFFEICFKNEIHHIPNKGVICISSDNKVSNIYTDSQFYKCYQKLSVIAEKLPSKNFIMVHKSYLVNYNYIAIYKYDSITMTNGLVIPISQALRSQVRKYMMTYKS